MENGTAANVRRNRKNNLQENRSAAAEFRQKPLLVTAQSPFLFNALKILHGRLTQCRRPHTLPSDVNYALKLPLAYGTGECLSLVFESVIRSRSAPR